MSKKSSVNKSKKTGRRLKRSVRRTLAAVLMITAIGVAAIPVPENLAEEPTPGIGEGTGNETAAVIEPKLYDYKVAETDTTYSNNITSLKDKSGKDKTTHPTYTVRESGSGYPRLIWQYKYFREQSGGNIYGIISGYNSKYLTSEIRIDDSIITEYVTIDFKTYNKYYSGDETTSVGDADNNGHNHVEYKCTSPERPILAVEFMEEYFPNDFKAYKDDYAAWEKSEETDKGPAPTLSKTVGDLSDIQKQRYYCTDETNRVTVGGRSISLNDYTLVQVIDEGDPEKDYDSSITEDQYVFIPQLVKMDPANKQVDPNGYLSQGYVSINGIGDEVFKGVQNVTSLTTSEDFPLNFIGVSAFEDSYIQNIDISNVTNISDRAFKGCHNLVAISMGQNNRIIGTEAFYDTRLREIKFEKGVTQIGAGAFAECTAMQKIDFSKLENPVSIEKYAFYNTSSLTSVIVMKSGTDFSQADFDKPGVESTAMVPIDTIGDGAFAVKPASSTLTTFTFPAMIARQQTDAGSVGLGDCVLAGRSGLQYVTMPSSFGQSRNATVPLNTFYNCFNLKCVKFPDNGDYSCAFAAYDSVTDKDDPSKSKQLFASVNTPDFYVKGPKMANGGAAASPRRSTWTATTSASDVVPYLYIEGGKKFYEVSNGTYLMCINENGYLTSCTLMDGIVPKDTDLTIPSEVGSTKVVGIAEGCFSDENLNHHVINLTISDNSISEIANGVFKGWKKLAKVYIGNSVAAIGNDAFADCNNLVDVTFSSPMNGNHQAFKIGTNAFKTGSPKLTFHGDIVKGYAPFEWAMDPNNIIKQPEGIRVCYKSLTPTYLTVMYNPNTELVTLLDYPKYNQVSKVLNEVHEHELFDSAGNKVTYERWMELRSYDEYRASYYDDMRAAFANAWNTAENKEDVYNSDNYGPWVNPEFCRNMVSGSGSGGGNETTSSSSSTTQPGDGGEPTPPETEEDPGNALNTLTDWLFEPIVAYAAEGDPIPYYLHSGNGYDVVKYSEMKDRKPWQTITSEAEALINATKEIVVPVGVDSIDVYGYYNNLDREGKELEVRVADNRENAKQYLTGVNGWDTDTIKMYTIEFTKDEDNISSVPGLFSGTYNDKAGEDKEKRLRGNDRIISVTLNSVKYLPDYAFDSCEQLTSVILGPDCADIGTAPFRGCYSLKAVGDNNYYKTNNGIVYSVNPDGSYTIEECLWARGLAGGVGEAQVSLSTDENLGRVSVIKDGAFEDCDNITLVDLTNTAGLVELPKSCFKNCDNLNRVWLPGTVNSIEDEAFAGANQLSELQIPGKEVFISGHAFDENKAATTSVYTSEDSSAKRYVDTYGKRYKLEWHKKDNWRVIFLDADLNQIGKEQIVDDGAYADIPEDPVKDDWVFDRWLGTNNADPKNPIKADTTFVAVGYSTSSMVDGKYKVDFMDQVDGKIFSTQLVAPGGDAIIPQAPVHAGYTFLKYGGDSLTNIQKNSIALAMYSGGTGTGTGVGGNGGNGTTSGSSSSTQSSSSDSVSGNSTSTTSSGAESVGKYTVTVINGSGSGTYDAGSTVIIAANTPATGKVFKNWTTESAGVTFASVSLSATTFVMPNNNVTVTANYVNGTGGALTGTSTNGNTGNNNNNNGGTRVDITKPGISNKDLATANVNGSTDNFVVKISETPEATQAVVNALTNKYGNLDSVLYYAMDISLYDSTGTVKISDITGLTVDITIPIPDALTVFGGNNMAGAVVAGDQLEDLSERFSTINGVPCISFTATHFSPYTIYVNTQQLSDGALDITPKTGDPIHPKWFLSLGLACLSVILFMKKDKKPVKVKAV